MSNDKQVLFQSVQQNENFTTRLLPQDAIVQIGRGCIKDIALSPDGMYLAVAGYAGLWLYAFPAGVPEMLWDAGKKFYAVTCAKSGKWIAAGTPDGHIKVWDVSSRECVVEFARGKPGRDNWIDFLAFSPDGQQLAAAGGSPPTYSVDIWQLNF